MGTALAEYSSSVGVQPPLLGTTTTTVIYLNDEWLANAWGNQKKDFFESDVSGSSQVSAQDEIFISHLLQIHARFCIEPSCKKDTSRDDSNDSETKTNKMLVHSESFYPSRPTMPAKDQNITVNLQFNSGANWNRPLSGGVSSDVANPCSTGITSYGEGGTSSLKERLPRNRHDEEKNRGCAVPMESPDISHDQTEDWPVRVKDEPDDQQECTVGEDTDELLNMMPSSSQFAPGVTTQPDPEGVPVAGGTDEMVAMMPSTSQSAPGLTPQPDQEGVSDMPHLTNFTRTRTGKRRHDCGLCPKSYTKECHLDRHMKTHTGEKPYQCDICLKAFAVKYQRDEHRRTHTGEKPYQCHVCYKSFTTPRSLTIHMRTHTAEKPYACGMCSKSFRQKPHLDSHIRTHTGEKPHQCDICLKSFAQKGNLMTHIMTHDGEKRYHCDICSKSFSSMANLCHHKKRHTGKKPYQCDVCSKSFLLKQQLGSHMRTHTGEKPFQCDICFQNFAFKYDVDKHKKVHSSEKPFHCDVCSKSFAQKSYLDKHKILHFGENLIVHKKVFEC